MTSERKIRVLMAKLGLNGHDRGAKVVARFLRDAGMEVIYTGRFQTLEQVVEAAVQEDVDVLGLSSLSGAHIVLFPELMKMLRERRADDILVIGGGVVPDDDIKTLKKAGIAEIFGPGTPMGSIITFIQENIRQ